MREYELIKARKLGLDLEKYNIKWNACVHECVRVYENGIEDFEECYIKFDAGYLYGVDPP